MNLRSIPRFLLLLLTIFLEESLTKGKGNAKEECPEQGDQPRSTFLWSVDAPWRTVPAFLFGTIHIPYDRVWANISPRVKQAFDVSETVVFELALQRPETVEWLSECKQLPPGQAPLREQLGTELHQRLKKFMQRLRLRLIRRSLQKHRWSRAEARRQVLRLFPADWERRRPVWLLFLLFQLGDSLPNENGGLTAGANGKNGGRQIAPMLDLFLAQMALDQGKELLSMESVAEQCSPLESVRPDQLLFAINYTLQYLEWAEAKEGHGRAKSSAAQDDLQSASALDRLIRQYRCGTLGTGLEQVVFGAHRFAQHGFSASPELDQQARQLDNLLVEDILLRRNERMAKRADAMLRENSASLFFFALGAGHFLGERSLLAHFRQMGYWVTPIEDDSMSKRLKLPSSWPPIGPELAVPLRRDSLLLPLLPPTGQRSALPRVAIRLREVPLADSASATHRPPHWMASSSVATVLILVMLTAQHSLFHLQ